MAEKISKEEELIKKVKLGLEMASKRYQKEASSPLIRLNYILLALTVVSWGIIVYLAITPPKPPIILTTDANGAVTPITSFRQPPASPRALINIAQNYAMDLLDMNAINYERRIGENREFFVSERHFNAYSSAIQESSWFQGMLANQMSMRVVPVDIPVINRSGFYNETLGMTEWQVSVPVRIRIEGPGMLPQNIERVIIMQLVHARNPAYHHGIAIAGVQVRRRDSL